MHNKYTTYKNRCQQGKFKGANISHHRGPLDVFCTWAVAGKLGLDEFLKGVISRKPLRGELS